MRVLYVSTISIYNQTGGGLGAKRNYDSLCGCFGKESVEMVNLCPLRWDGIVSKIVSNFIRGVLLRNSESLFRQIKTFDNYDLIFLDDSYLGLYSKKIREKGYKGKIVVFFHNLEYDLVHLSLRKSKHNNLIKKLILNNVVKNEIAALRESDCCFFINKRDVERAIHVYHVKPQRYYIDEMSIKDNFFKTEESVNSIVNSPPIYTMLGSYFGPNVSGFMWFIENVYPYVKIRLRIIGKDIDRLKKQIQGINDIEFLSSVSDIAPYIIESDYMIFPIFEGSGMKVKTCEALMYAKNIIGTPEAFSGYNIRDYSKIGACCSTDKEFIDAIKTLKLPRYNKYSRLQYMSKFTLEKSIERKKNAFIDLGLC